MKSNFGSFRDSRQGQRTATCSKTSAGRGEVEGLEPHSEICSTRRTGHPVAMRKMSSGEMRKGWMASTATCSTVGTFRRGSRSLRRGRGSEASAVVSSEKQRSDDETISRTFVIDVTRSSTSVSVSTMSEMSRRLSVDIWVNSHTISSARP